MLVFIDESGDSGMQKKVGSSRLFIITAVLFADNEDAEQCDQRIEKIRQDLDVDEQFEFRFNKCCDRYRAEFLKGVAGSNFFYSCIVLNKEKLTGPGFQFKDSFYKYAASLVFTNAKPLLLEAKVIIDECGNREFKNQLSTYLKKRMNEDSKILIRKVAMESSHSNNLLQLADMVSGAVFRSFDTRKANRKEFRNIIRAREYSVQIWPR
ncbi:MAG TPA: DUF3800 domain-containing protein [Candidatus Acidoferrum sp.]|nr:DUF3800 domain-containing protein [Candidatus Acidoferrum sp.]